MTPDELEAIRARVAATTPGDWRRSQYTEPYTNAVGSDAIKCLQIGPFTAIKGYICCTVADAVFMAEARDDIQNLLNMLDEAKGRDEKLWAGLYQAISIILFLNGHSDVKLADNLLAKVDSWIELVGLGEMDSPLASENMEIQ